jgi:hypothetical protein
LPQPSPPPATALATATTTALALANATANQHHSLPPAPTPLLATGTGTGAGTGIGTGTGTTTTTTTITATSLPLALALTLITVVVRPFLAVVRCWVIFLWRLRKKRVQVILGVQVFLGSLERGMHKKHSLRSILTALPFFLPFLGFIAKSCYFFILEPFSIPNLFLCFFLIFYFILIPIASSFWFHPSFGGLAGWLNCGGGDGSIRSHPD